MNKKELMAELINDLKRETRAEEILVRRKGEIKNVGLVNHYKLHDFIPNKWFDWIDRVNAQVVIIGQDWGPYISLNKYMEEYAIDSKAKDFDYSKFLFKTFSSRTEKFIFTALTDSYKTKFKKDISLKEWDNIFFTVAVLFTRQGKHFRGNGNFDPARSFEISYPYLARQLDIIKPKIILASGGMAWDAISKYFNIIDLGRTLTDVMNKIKETGFIKVKDQYIIPNYHPASYADPKIIKAQFSRVWDLI